MNYTKAIKLLNLKNNPTELEIKNSYKKLAKIYHPDKNQGDKEKEEKFKEIQVAYDFLLKNQNNKEPAIPFHNTFDISDLFQHLNINSQIFNINNDIFNINNGILNRNINSNFYYPLPNQQVFIQKKREVINGQLIETITERKNGVTRTTKKIIKI